jgi:DNA-binding IclR family transcriptional regulator
MAEEISSDVYRLLSEAIPSYDELELLLSMRERAPDEWTRDVVMERLGLEAPAAIRVLEHLALHRLIERRDDGVYRYGPQHSELQETVDRLAAAYRGDRRLMIMRALTENAMQRLRNDAARAFADAFVVGRDKKP